MAKKQGLIKYVGFDMDGTLIDSAEEYIKLFGQIVEESWGVPSDSASSIFRETFGKPTDEQVLMTFRRHGHKISKDEAFIEGNRVASLLGQLSNAVPFSDVPMMLKELHEEGYGIFISSGQQEVIVKERIEKYELVEYIDFIAGIRPNEPKFKKGEPHFRAAANHFGIPFEIFITQTVFVGDTQTDIFVAQQSGIKAVGRIGINTAQQLLDYGSEKALSDLSTLHKVISSIDT